MANKTLFPTHLNSSEPKPNCRNEHGAPAYKFPAKHALAQYAATGCLNATYYASAKEQLTTILNLCQDIDSEFIGKTAIYCREKGYMKDVPALLCAVLSVSDPEVLKLVFPRVIDNGKQLRNFVQIMRSGAVGRKSLGSLPKRLVRNWLAARKAQTLFRDSIGNQPSLADVIKMVHPHPESEVRSVLYAYLLGKEHDAEKLPAVVRAFEDYKVGKTNEVPDVPFQMLASLNLGTREWTEIARNAPWKMTLMNLNTFARHDVFGTNPTSAGIFTDWVKRTLRKPSTEMVDLIADRIRDTQAMKLARIFPYQIMVAHCMLNPEVPETIRKALLSAMESAIENVPRIKGQVYVCPDVSGSMAFSSITGHRKGSSSVVRCIDVAALISAAMVRTNPNTKVIPFEHEVVSIKLPAKATIFQNAKRLASIGGGGTNCSAPLALLNKRNSKGDLVILVSDNQSWVDSSSRRTGLYREWIIFKSRNPNAKLVCLDIQPYMHTQIPEGEDVLNVGGFSDQVFEVIAGFAENGFNPGHFVKRIEEVEF